MAPKVPSVITCSSVPLLEHELSTIRAGLDITEAEDTWDKILNVLLRFNALVVGSVADYPTQLIAACKGHARAIINSMNSERSRLSGAATDVLATLATHLRRTFETLIPLFVPTLLSLASRSSKIFVARAKACLLSIIENCQSPLIIPLLRHAVSDKSVILRLTATDLVVACLNCFNPPDLETPNRIEDIENVIRATARDASADVRKSSRRAFEAYKVLFPTRLDAFIAPLTPTMKKYLDIKSAPVNQRKPPLSSSASAPALPSSSQLVDVLSRSQPPAQKQAKPANTNSAMFTRVEKSSKANPTSNPPTTTTESTSMPPPPPPKPKSSSGPVRPPPSMRQAVAQAPSRPLNRLNRHASRTALQTSNTTGSALDMSKSQPILHGGAQRPEKIPSPPIVSPATDAPKPISDPLEAAPTLKPRTTTGPRRVLKPEPVPLPTSAPPEDSVPSDKQLKGSTKVKEHQKTTFTSSTSSATSVPTRAPVFSRPPSRLASSTHSNTAEEMMGVKEAEREKEKEKARLRREKNENEVFKRPKSRAGGEFHPRPASRTEGETHKRSVSRDEELQVRPASRMDGERPASRMDKPPSRMDGDIHPRDLARAEKRAAEERSHRESRAEAKAAKLRRKAVEQMLAQQQAESVAPASAQPNGLAKPEHSKKKRREEHKEQLQADVLPAPKHSKGERSVRDKPSKKRRAEAKEMEAKQSLESEKGLLADAADDARTKSPQLTPTEEQGKTAGKTLKDEEDLPEPQPETEHHDPSPVDSRSRGKTSRNDPSAHYDDAVPHDGTREPRQGGSPIAEGRVLASDEVRPVREEVLSEKTLIRTIKLSGESEESGTVRPLAVHKDTPNGFDEGHKEDNARLPASGVPLPPSPPPSAYPCAEFVTPAPLRHAMASSRYQVPQTPISKLLAAIQRGFDPDFSMIGEESQVNVSPPSPRPEEQMRLEELTMEGDRAAASEDTLGGFIDTRPRKLKSSHGKERNGRARERVPLTPRAENCR